MVGFKKFSKLVKNTKQVKKKKRKKQYFFMASDLFKRFKQMFTKKKNSIAVSSSWKDINLIHQKHRRNAFMRRKIQSNTTIYRIFNSTIWIYSLLTSKNQFATVFITYSTAQHFWFDRKSHLIFHHCFFLYIILLLFFLWDISELLLISYIPFVYLCGKINCFYTIFLNHGLLRYI